MAARPAVVSVDAFGCLWRLELVDLGPALTERLRDLWRRAAAEPSCAGDPRQEGAVETFTVARVDDRRFSLDGTLVEVPGPDLPYAVSRALTSASISRRRGQCVMLHAAGLAHPDGGTVALVAGSGTGKSTAARTVGRRLGYVTDETVAVEHDLTVRPYPKPVSVVRDPADPHGKSEHSPDELGLMAAPAGLRLTATVVLERAASAGSPTLDRLSLVDAAAVTLPQTSALASLDRPLDRLATVLAAGRGPWRLRYRDIEDCGDLLSELAAGSDAVGSPAPHLWTWVAGAPASPVMDGPAGWIVRAPFDEALMTTEGVLVLRGGVPLRLTGVAAALWAVLDDPVPRHRLTHRVVSDLGPSQHARALVARSLRLLQANALVTISGIPARARSASVPPWGRSPG